MSGCLLCCFIVYWQTCSLSLVLISHHTGWFCSSVSSCTEWTHSDCPEVIGSWCKCKPSEQGPEYKTLYSSHVPSEHAMHCQTVLHTSVLAIASSISRPWGGSPGMLIVPHHVWNSTLYMVDWQWWSVITVNTILLSQNGCTALYFAGKNGHSEVVELLLQAGARDIPNKVMTHHLFYLRKFMSQSIPTHPDTVVLWIIRHVILCSSMVCHRMCCYGVLLTFISIGTFKQWHWGHTFGPL